MPEARGAGLEEQPHVQGAVAAWAKEGLEELFHVKVRSGGSELFQILKDDTVKVLYSICQPIWKTQQWPQDWKRSVFIPIPKKGNAKMHSQTTAQLHSSHMLVK